MEKALVTANKQTSCMIDKKQKCCSSKNVLNFLMSNKAFYQLNKKESIGILLVSHWCASLMMVSAPISLDTKARQRLMYLLVVRKIFTFPHISSPRLFLSS